MLVLSRKPKEVIVIGQDIKVTIISVNRDQVRIGIDAPPDIPVHRYEVYLAIREANRAAASLGTVTKDETTKILAGIKRPKKAPSTPSMPSTSRPKEIADPSENAPK